ncbi:MAG TPA: hypothetical protein VG407_07955 [Caulobacteraceae bacterium]|jgi:hypothetical protein|nr:hypothetical protein [Caulobacteraceae bacterium]
MLEPAFIGASHRIDVRSVAEMRRVLIPFEDETTRMTASADAIRSVMAAARKQAGEITYETIARELFKRFSKDASAAKPAS